MKRYIADAKGNWIPREEYYARKADNAGPTIMPDIEPYQSMITGETIASRSKHREHLKQHSCQEIGNDVKPLLKFYENMPDVAPQQRHELIRAQIDAMTQDQFRAALKKDADRVKWNSRKD